MITRRMSPGERAQLEKLKFNAVGLIQANVASIFYYGDIVAKASNVVPFEIMGNCPTSITTLAFFGETSAVQTAMRAVEQKVRDSHE
ncbi:MAG: BMC domain-containing protein [Lachnospiraceae bacterium]|nr:BMC domain-containing protein [Lachnospiraceae bacterium]